MSANTKTPSLFSLSMSGKCPACYQTSLFSSAVAFKASCEECGLDISDHDNGDGPATGVMLVAGAVMLMVAFFIEVSYHPPLWVHIVVGSIVILLSSWWSLRFFKAMLLTLHYRLRIKEQNDV